MMRFLYDFDPEVIRVVLDILNTHVLACFFR